MRLFYYFIHDSDVISLQSEINTLFTFSSMVCVNTYRATAVNRGDCVMDEFLPSLFVSRETNGSMSKKKQTLKRTCEFFLLPVGFLQARQKLFAVLVLLQAGRCCAHQPCWELQGHGGTRAWAGLSWVAQPIPIPSQVRLDTCSPAGRQQRHGVTLHCAPSSFPLPGLAI